MLRDRSSACARQTSPSRASSRNAWERTLQTEQVNFGVPVPSPRGLGPGSRSHWPCDLPTTELGVTLQQPRLHLFPVAAVTRPRELLAKHHGGSLAYSSGGQASEWSLGRRWGHGRAMPLLGAFGGHLHPGLSGLRRPPACFSSRPLLRLQRVPSRPLTPLPHCLLHFCFSRLPLRGPWRLHWVYVENLLGHVVTGSGIWMWLSLGATVLSSTLIKRLTSSHHTSGNWDLRARAVHVAPP